MKSLSSVDLFFLAKELQALVDERIDSFYCDDKCFVMKVYLRRKGNLFFHFFLPSSLTLSEKKHIQSSGKSSFVGALRKYLSNAYITSVVQVEGERILILRVQRKVEDEIKDYYLVFELFAKGNILLCDKDMMITHTFATQHFRDRTLKTHQKYEIPKNSSPSLTSVSKEELQIFLSHSPEKLVSALAKGIGLGGTYSELLCSMSKLDKNKLCSELNEQEKTLLFQALESLRNMSLKACVQRKGNILKDAFPFLLEGKEDLEEVESFSKALELLYEQDLKSAQKRKDPYSEKIASLDRRLKKQEELKENILTQSEELQRKGELLYEKYALVEDLLKGMQKLAADKGWGAVHEKIKQTPALSAVVKKLDEKKNLLILDL